MRNQCFDCKYFYNEEYYDAETNEEDWCAHCIKDHPYWDDNFTGCEDFKKGYWDDDDEE